MLRNALAHARQIGHREWISLALLNLEDLLVFQRKFSQARENCLEGLVLARQLGHREWTAAHLINLGIANRWLFQIEDAKNAFDEGFRILRQLQRPEMLAEALCDYANFLVDQALLEQASKAFQEILTLVPEQGTSLLMRARYGLARIAEAQGDWQQAYCYGEASLQAMTEPGHFSQQEVREWFAALLKRLV